MRVRGKEARENIVGEGGGGERKPCGRVKGGARKHCRRGERRHEKA